MQLNEAIELVSRRTRTLGAKLRALSVMLVFASFVGVYLGTAAISFLVLGRAWHSGSLVIGAGVSLVVVLPMARASVKRVVGVRRAQWIRTLAETEGLDAEALARSVPPDSK